MYGYSQVSGLERNRATAEDLVSTLGGGGLATPRSQFVLNRWNLDQQRLPQSARAHARYGIDECLRLSAEDARRPEKFEKILISGRQIAFNIDFPDQARDSSPTSLGSCEF